MQAALRVSLLVVPSFRGATFVALVSLSCADRVILAPVDDARSTEDVVLPSDGSSTGERLLDGTTEVGESSSEVSSDGVGSSTDACSPIELSLVPRAPHVLMLVDQSFSMRARLDGTTSRWDAVYRALFDPSSGVVVARENELRIGLTLYTTSFERGVRGPPMECPRLRSPEPWFAPAADLATLFATQPPLGHTPTGEAIDAVTPLLVAAVGESAVVILTTDGEPDTCADGFVDDGQVPALVAARSAFSRGLALYVVSVGDEIQGVHLQELANAGLGKPVDDSEPAPYHLAHSEQELAAAYTEILERLPSCVFELEGAVELDRMCEGEVRIDGVPAACGTAWAMPDPSTVVLRGERCMQARRRMPLITASWPCDAVQRRP